MEVLQSVLGSKNDASNLRDTVSIKRLYMQRTKERALGGDVGLLVKKGKV